VIRSRTWFIRVRNRQGLAEVANHLAPEHLQIMTRNPRPLITQIRTAGGIFVGNHTPTVLGDFAAGPSHTLPTGGAGHSFSGLRVIDFMRRTSIVEYSRSSLKRAEAIVQQFAETEHLPLHRKSLGLRSA